MYLFKKDLDLNILINQVQAQIQSFFFGPSSSPSLFKSFKSGLGPSLHLCLEVTSTTLSKVKKYAYVLANFSS